MSGINCFSACDVLESLATDRSTEKKQDKVKGTGKSKKKRKQRSETEQTKGKKNRPNYFIGIQIKKPEILGKILCVQNHITATDPRFTKAVVSISTTHLTLAVMYLKDEESISKVSEILDNNRDEVLSIVGPTGLDIHLEDLGNFGDNVLFVNISPGPDLIKLTKLSNLLVQCCSEFGSKDQKAFKPHATILKLSKIYGQGRKKIRKISPYLFSELKQLSFGCETPNNLQLLSMMKKKQPSGYYHTEYTLSFGEKSNNDGRWSLRHWAECVAVACIVSALYIPFTNPLNEFSDYTSEQIIQSGLKSYEKIHLLKRGSKNDKIRLQLGNLKKMVSSEEMKQQIREGLGLT